MTLPLRRLAELEAIGRTRSLTDEEQREAMLRAKQDRRNRTRKRTYFLDPDYRRQCIERSRANRRRYSEAAE